MSEPQRDQPDESGRGRRLLIAAALFLALTLAAIATVRNYDLFWHLATGRWIAEHRALPLHDPFALASDRHEWINGEWLFEVFAWSAVRIVSIEGLSWLRGLLAATVFTATFVLTRRVTDSRSAFFLAAIAFAGASPTLDFRPSSFALLFVVASLSVRSPIAHAIVSMLWINVHPSALLAPGIAALSTRRVLPVIASALALLVNPHGVGAIVSPLRLMSWVSSGAFVNAEWLPSHPTQFPLLYLCVTGAAVVFAMRRAEWWRILLFLGFAYLAIRHVRNQGLFFAAFPLLVAPSLPELSVRFRRLVIAAGVAAVAIVAVTTDHRMGVASERFPLRAVARLKESGLRGNLYNPDQYGGYLIWSFYPERRVLTDGRNELYRSFIPEYAAARGDERAWRALLRKYEVDLAVDEYRPPLAIRDAKTGAEASMPASLAYWPRREWALIAFDEAGMVFARRAAFSPELIAQWELRGVVPDR